MPNNKTTAVFDLMNSTCKHVKNYVQAIKSYFKWTTSHFFYSYMGWLSQVYLPFYKETTKCPWCIDCSKFVTIIVKWVYLGVVICQPLGISYSRGRSPRITDDKLTFVQIPTEYRKPYGGLVSFALGIILFIKQHVFISLFWY